MDLLGDESSYSVTSHDTTTVCRNVWALIAPGPSACAEQAERVRHLNVGAVGCAYQLAPWANFIAAADRSWWVKYPDVSVLSGRKFTMSAFPNAEKVTISYLGSVCNSGVLALEVAKNLGATRILLLGYDMKGSHFFGKYTNGLRNTTPLQRSNHFKQYEQWARTNKAVEVINCTQGSALTCFPKASLDEVLVKSPLHRP